MSIAAPEARGTSKIVIELLQIPIYRGNLWNPYGLQQHMYPKDWPGKWGFVEVQWTMYKVEVPRAAGSPDLEPALVRAAYSSPRCSRVSGGTVGSLEKTNRTPPDGGVA